MRSMLSDLRYAARELRRRPGFALTAILSLALGIGATSAVFSVVYGVLLNPFPYTDSDRMMQLAMREPSGRFRYAGMSGAQIDELRKARSVESVVGEDGWNLTTTDGDIPEDVVASYVTPNSPNHWGVLALMGRWFIPADGPAGQEPERVVVLGYRFWQRYYSGDPGVVGRTLQLVRKDYQIVGVMPPRFRWRDADIYLPLKVRFEPNIYYGVNLRIRQGVSVEEANAELQPILQEFAKQTPARYPETFRVQLRSIIEMYARPMGPRLYLLLGAVASLLLVGCANVSILLLVRGAHRQQELAVRAAIGAARVRLVRQLLTEALLIAVTRHGPRRGDRLEEPGAHRRLDSHQLVRVRIGHRHEPAGALVQRRAGDRDGRRVRRLAGAPAFASGPGARDASEHSPRDRQRSRPAAPSHAGGGPGRADARDADRGRRGRKGIPAPRECGPRLRPREHDVAADSRPRRHVQDVEGAVRVLRAASRRGRRDAPGRVRGDFDQRDAAWQTAATAPSRFTAAARPTSPSSARTSSAPSIFRCFAFHCRRAVSGPATRSDAARRSP